MTDWTHDLDRLDLRILKALRGEGRISNLKLAGSVALSPSAVLAGCGAFCGTATFWATVQMYPEIMECHMVAGGFAYLLKTRMEGMAAYCPSAGNALWQLPGIFETQTYAVMEEVKNATQLTLGV